VSSQWCNHSFHPEFGLDVEWSVNVEVSFSVKSLGLDGIHLIDVSDLPLERSLVLLGVTSNKDTFFILGILNVQDFALLVVEEVAIESEELVPV
jgi:hypothetical protein